MKFSKVASFAFLALSSQAAIIKYDSDAAHVKRDAVLSGSADNQVVTSVVTKRDSDLDAIDEVELAKRLSVSGLLSAIISQLPSLFTIIGNILKGSGIVKRSDVDNALDSVVADLPQILGAIDSALSSAAKAKRDDTTDAINGVIAQLPDIVSQVVAGVDQTVKATNGTVNDVGLTTVSNLPTIISAVVDNILKTVNNAKRDGTEDIVGLVVRQLPDLISDVSTPILTSAEKFKREEDSSLLNKLVKKGISSSIQTFGAANVASVVSKRGVSSFLAHMFTRA
ncbi:Extent of cell elongation protein 1 [Candida viswanathii]|uniref:Extent of cell elongation protein 1 n=1 Tax=Candida viswanathii TaxID=5486 RepID=A0A367Y9K2_9ASCO|nr:Extent of cell elongation protein 1 [Candida viswanathii]